MNNSLYLDCTTGISGDMTVAALLDLGADQEVLERALNSIRTGGFHTEISRVVKSGIEACDFAVVLSDGHDNHDHDMEYLFGIDGPDEHDHEHHHGHEHHHDHEHHHGHRHLAEINEIIEGCDMTDGAKEIAGRTFRILAEAEAEAHASTPEEVAFHEAGAVDSIVDIIAASVCIDDLAPSRVYVPVLYEGRGTVRCQHGILPVPVPAVVNIVRASGLPLHISDYRGEYVTPTGAAFAAAVATDHVLPDRFRIVKTGIGAGKRAYAVPGMLRAMLIEEETEYERESMIVKLESNIDDSTGEELGYVLEKLLEAGARDVSFYPVYMKKNRPAYQLNVICLPSELPLMESIIFRETTTIGIRRALMERSVLERSIVTLDTSLGKADVKIAGQGEKRRIYPEYSTARMIAEKKNIPLREVMRTIEREASEKL